MKTLVRIDMEDAGDRPNGMALQRFSGRVGGQLCRLTLTSNELHLTFTDCDGPAFAISLHALADAMTAAAETLIFGAKK